MGSTCLPEKGQAQFFFSLPFVKSFYKMHLLAHSACTSVFIFFFTHNPNMNFCKGCKAPCCRDYVITVTSQDILRIMGKTGKKPEEFAQLYPATILNLNEETVLECHEEGLRYDYILALKSHPCIFLGENSLCTIHEFAPYVCRSYPKNSLGKPLKGANAGCSGELLLKSGGFPSPVKNILPR